MSLSDEDKIATTDELLAAGSTGDFDRVATFLTDDFSIEQDELLPFGGRWTGKEALREHFPLVFGAMDVADLKIIETLAAGDYVVRITEFEFADKSLEKARLSEMFLFRGDKICEIRPYYFSAGPLIAACKAKAGK